MAPDVDLDAIVSMIEGYSGSDLKNLCVIVAYCPIQEMLEKEGKETSKERQRKTCEANEDK